VGAEGGFEGLRNKDKKQPVTDDADKLAIAISVVSNEPTVETIQIDGWADDEKCRVYIAVSNYDGTVDLKDSKLTKEHLASTLLLVKSDKVRRENPPKPKKAVANEVNKGMVLQSEAALQAEMDKLKNLEMKLAAAVANGDATRQGALSTPIAVTKGMIDYLQQQIKGLREAAKA